MARKSIFRRPVTYVVALAVAIALVLGYFKYIKKDNDSIGAGVRVQGTQLKDGLQATRDSRAVKLPYPRELVRSIVSYQIGPSGTLPAPMTVRLPVDPAKAKPAPGEQLMVFTAESAKGPWESIPATLDGSDVVVTVQHLSVFDVAKVKIGNTIKGGADKAWSVISIIGETFHGLTDDVFVNARAPKCAGGKDALKDGYLIQPTEASKKKNTVLWCIGMARDKAGKLVRAISMVNNRKYAVTVTHPKVGVIEAGALRGELSELSRAVSGKNSVLLPGETIVFGPVEFPSSGGATTFHVEMDGFAQSLYALETGLRTAATILTRFGAGSSSTTTIIKDPIKRLDAIDLMLKVPDCANAMRQADADIGAILRGCLSAKNMGQIFGKSSIFLAPIMVLAPVIKYFQSQFNALGDQFNDRDSYDLVVGRVNMDELCPEGPEACYGTRSVDLDGNGKLDSVAIYLDAEADKYAAKVIYDNGDTASQHFEIPPPKDADGSYVERNPQKEHFSYFGFSDTNGDGMDEIFVKALVDSQWYIDTLGGVGPEDSDGERPLFQLLINNDTLFPMSTSTPYVLDAFWTSQIVTAGGFQCSKDPSGKPIFSIWWARTTKSGQYIDKNYYGLDPNGGWSSTWVDDDLKLPKGRHGEFSGSITSLIERERTLTCPGLPKLPTTGVPGGSAKDAILDGAGIS